MKQAVKVSKLKLDVLKSIQDLSSSRDLNIVRPSEISKVLNKSDNLIRVTLQALKKLELVESPIETCWRLTKKGEELISET